MLTFPITKPWMDRIKAGEKKEEYRDLTKFYISRLAKFKGQVIDIKLLNGYSSKADSIIIRAEVTTGTGLKEWGAIPGKYYFVLKIKEVIL